MARLTEEQRAHLATLAGEGLADSAIVEALLRIEEPEEPAVDAMRMSQEVTIAHLRRALKHEQTVTRAELTNALTLAYDERDEARAKLEETERERDEARAALDALEEVAGVVAVALKRSHDFCQRWRIENILRDIRAMKEKP